MTERERGEHTLPTISIQVTGDCNLACTYCYQHSKNSQMVDIELAKRFIDKIIENDQSFWNGYIDFNNKNGVLLDFVGGEPLVNYKAVIELCDYFKESCIKHNKMSLYCHSILSISTNGTIFNDDIEALLKRHKGRIYTSVTIDGCKELHDTCRRFKGANKPSYDIVVDNFKKFRKYCDVRNTKLTLSPQNLDYLCESIDNLYENLGIYELNSNCVYEDVWTYEDAQKLYWLLKKVADKILENYDDGKRRFSFFNEYFFNHEDHMDKSWCGGNGRMLFMQYDGKIFPCIRYSETSTGKGKDFHIGTVEKGITQTDRVCLLKSLCRDKYYDEQCRQCPISRGCSECLAYMYEVNGNFDSKLKTLCYMHKARSLANVYYWNKKYMEENSSNVFLMYLPKIEADALVGKEEADMLFEMSNLRFAKSMDANQDKMKSAEGGR